LIRLSLPYLVLGAEGDVTRLTDVEICLHEQGLNNISCYNAKDNTPTQEYLSQFNSILCFSYFGFSNANELGNRLATYVENGGGVIIMSYANCGTGNMIKGAWEINSYDPIIPSDTSRPPSPKGLGEIKRPDHPIMEGVLKFSGGEQNSHSPGRLNPNAQLIASWSHGAPLVVELTNKIKGKIVGLNFYPTTNRAARSERPPNTDGSKLIANALFYVSSITRGYNY